MDIQTVTAIFVFLLTIDLVPNIQGKEVSVSSSRQNGVCQFYPQVKCSSDCSSLMVCHNPTLPPINLKCPTNQPYCFNGKCGRINSNCQQRDEVLDTERILCTTDGVFPDPTNCTNMIICEGGVAMKVPCQPGYIFNSKTNACERGTPRTDHASRRICQKISCANVLNDYILFTANPAYYTFCSSSGSMLLYKCPDVENQVYDIPTQTCVFKCKAAGYFSDPDDCTIFYSCEGFANNFRVTTMYCATGLYFDGTKCGTNSTNCSIAPGGSRIITDSPTSAISFKVSPITPVKD